MRDISFKSRFSNLFYACIAVSIFVGLTSIFGGVYEERQNYEKLPAADKASTEALIDTVARAERNDFLVFRDGRVAIICGAGKSEFGVEVRFKAYAGAHIDGLLFEAWRVRRDLDRVVKRSDPDACAVALKFLSQ